MKFFRTAFSFAFSDYRSNCEEEIPLKIKQLEKDVFGWMIAKKKRTINQ